MWWKHEPGVSGFLAFSNITQKPINATLRVTDAQDADLETRQFTVSPHGTQLVNFSQLLSTSSVTGGIYVTHDGPAHSLVTNGGLEDELKGYSAHLYLLPSPQPPSGAAQPNVSETTFSELGLMSGAADPMMNFPAGTTFTPYSVVRNISDQPASVTPTLWWMEGAAPHSSQLPAVIIAPHRTVNLDAPALIAAAGLKNFNGSVNLVLDAKAQEGALTIASGSVDQTNTYVFEVIPRGVSESASKSLSYWSTGNGDDTMVTLWNPADEAQDFVFTLFYTSGQYAFPIHLAPRATQMFNISELIRNQIPDAQGHIIPLSIHEGSAQLSGPLGENQLILVSMDAGTYNVNKAICGVYCQTCNGYTGFAIADDPFSLPISANKQELFYGQESGGGQYPLSANWGSSNTSVATVGSTNGLVSGVSPGSVTISAQDNYTEPEYVPNYCTPGYACPVYYFPDGSSGGSVTPSLTLQGNQYNSIFVGTDPNLGTPNSIFATVSPSGGTFTETSSASGDTFTNVQSGGPGWVVHTSTQSTNPGDRTITVTYTVNSQSATQSLNLTAREFAYATNNSPSNTCALGYGTFFTYVYTLYTHPDHSAVQPGIGLDGTSVSESFSPAPPSQAQTGNGNLDSNSQFTDIVAYCSNSPLTVSENVTQTLSIEGYQVRQNLLTYSSSGVTLTNQGPTQ